MMIELVEITAITKTIEHVRDRQRAAYEQLSSKKTIARHIASTHVEFCDQLLQAIGKMEKTEVTQNEHRELRGMSPVMKGPLPPPVTVEPGTVKYWDGEKEYTIQACPHCGGTARVWGACNVDNITIRYVECDACGAKSGVYSKGSDAIAHWNERTGK